MNGGILLYKRDLDISEDIKREKMFLNKENEEEDFLSEVAITDNKNSDEITFLDEQDYFKEEAMFTSPILIRVYEEINKIVQFSMSLENVNIDRVYLYGDRENLEEIADYISDNIIFKSQKIANISDLLLNEEIDITKFFIAIGNVLRK